MPMKKALREGRTVLIVDDDSDNREIFSLSLSMYGYSVLEATNGADALTKMSATPAQAILTDGRMPVMNGYELAAVLKGIAAWRAIPIVMLSALPPTDDAEAKSLFAAHLHKPCSIDVLLDTLDQVLGI